jgi:hypothetical protein
MSSKLFRTVLVVIESKRKGEGMCIISYNFVAALGIRKEEEQ